MGQLDYLIQIYGTVELFEPHIFGLVGLINQKIYKLIDYLNHKYMGQLVIFIQIYRPVGLS